MQDKTQNKDCGKTPKDSNDKYFLAMSNVAIAHPLFKARLFEYFDFDIKKTFECDTNDIKLADEYWGGLSCPRDFFKERDNTDPDKFYDNFMELSSGENLSKGKPLKDTAFSEPLAKGIKYITYDSGNYPAMLKGIADFPLMLYYKGDFSGVNFDKTVAFVGSRKASTYAREILGTIISAFKGLDILVGDLDVLDACSLLYKALNALLAVFLFLRLFLILPDRPFQKLRRQPASVFSYPYHKRHGFIPYLVLHSALPPFQRVTGCFIVPHRP